MKSHPFTLAVRDELSRQLSGQVSDFQAIKLQQSDIRDALCLCYAPSKLRRAWIVLGSDKESPTWLRAFAGWTTEGLPYNRLAFTWLGDRPHPPSGVFDALEIRQYDEAPAPFDGLSGLRIEIAGPSPALQETVTMEYLSSPAFQSWLDRVMPFEQRKKAPPTRDEVAIQSGEAERIFMRQWVHLLERKPEAVSALVPYLEAPVAALANLVTAHIVPTLNHLLAT